MRNLLSVAEALQRVLDHAAPLPAEEMPLADAAGLVLASPLKARRTQPPADVSAMDGYAVRAADVADAPVRLKVIGEVAAGRPFAQALGAGEAARIFTGGVLAARRRHHRDPGAHRARRRQRRDRKRPAEGPARPRRGTRLHRRRRSARSRTPADRAGSGARGRHELSAGAGAPAAEGGAVRDRRRTGDAGLGACARSDRLVQQLRDRGAGARRRRDGGRSSASSATG